MSAYCTECGAEINEKAEICPECGVRQDSAETSVKEATSGLQGNTLVNTIIGAVVGIITALIPVLGFLSPAFGGAVGGFLQKEGAGGGAKVGALVTVALLIPISILLVVAGGLITSFLPEIGPGAGAAAGGLGIVVVLILAIPSFILSIIGGVIGGAMGGSPE
jgi:hypothetical protein